jgi:hypothetical protein
MPKGVYPHTHIRPKVYAPEMVTRVTELYVEQGLSQVEVAAELGVTLKVIYRLMVNHDIPRRPQVKRDQRGERNAYWRGPNAGYAAFHKRVEAARGTPQHCAACDTDEPGRYEWANLSGRYDDLNDYVRMCILCHRKLDAHRRSVTGARTSPKRGGDAACPQT